MSLRTRDKKRAIYLARKYWIAMQDYTAPFPWELEHDRQAEKYWRGKKLQAQFPDIDLNNPFHVDRFVDSEGADQLRDLLFAQTFDLELNRESAPKRELETYVAPARLACTPLQNPIQAELKDSKHQTITLESALNLFMLDHKELAPSSVKAYRHKCDKFLLIAAGANSSDYAVSDLTPEVIRNYSALLRDGYQISNTTVQSHFSTIKAFLTYSYEQQYLSKNFSSILNLKKVKSKVKRLALDEAELQTLFQAPEYQRGSFVRPSDYWVPLLGIYTGARQAELCQLHVADIYQDPASSIWVIDINDAINDADDTKRLKVSDSCNRRVPVHAQLKRLGLLDYVAEARAREQTRLFPHEKRNQTGEFSAFSKRFNRFRKSAGVRGSDTKLKDFHSFRHGVNTLLLNRDCPPHVCNELLGHSQANQSQGPKTYWDKKDLCLLDKWVQRIDYKIDFSGVRKNGWKLMLNGRESATD